MSQAIPSNGSEGLGFHYRGGLVGLQRIAIPGVIVRSAKHGTYGEARQKAAEHSIKCFCRIRATEQVAAELEESTHAAQKACRAT